MKITLLNGPTFDYQAYSGLPLKVVVSARAKRMSLRIDEKSRRPVFTLPRRCSTAKAKAFLDMHHDWIVNMLGRLPPAQRFTDGAEFAFFGAKCRLQHSPQIKGSGFVDHILHISGDTAFIHRRTIDFLKKQTLEHLSALTLSVAAQLRAKVTGISIKDTRSRWGSCSTSGRICYNWRICMAPIEVINYLVCHEVSHLKHPNHSADFWACVQNLCPDYVQQRAWLKKHGKTLYQYI
ncbi:MAG: M48 family metallopeptidase [Alphaproteobacteria bacterium]|nr:M48 family metallopeptidase [Alphaproteobacteria bacterium]